MNNFKLQRKEFVDGLLDNSITILYSGATKQESYDEDYYFSVNRNFYYVTGINQDDVYIMILKRKGTVKEIVYAAENDPLKIKWVGEVLYPEEIKEISEVNEVKFLNEFETDLVRLMRDNRYKCVYLDLEEPSFQGQRNFGLELKKKVNALALDKKVYDAYPLITRNRGVKKPYEIELFRHDVEVTRKALEYVMQNLSKCEYEYQVQALFEGAIKFYGNAIPSFHTIAGSGVNGATLHYSENVKKLDKNDMILLDLGANCNLYHADISRTYPLSGKYSPQQKTIYSIVLGCNKHIESMARPGVSIHDLQMETVKYLAKACLDAKLIKTEEEIKNYYFHGVSHHIGLDTHDPYPDRTEGLKAGMIISNEPGLYFKELGIGVRIEDDLLITEDGCENLSKDIIKDVDEVEAYIQKYMNK